MSGGPAWAQKKSRAPAQTQSSNQNQKLNPNDWQRGETMAASATVYESSDFDSKVIGRLKKGSKWTISKRIYGAFYQVRLPNNRIGYVTDADLLPIKSANQVRELKQNLEEKQKAQQAARAEKREGAHIEGNTDPRKGSNKFGDMTFYGLSFNNIRYTEDTMGRKFSEDMFLLGYKAAGNDVLIDELSTEFNAAFSLKPPSYYEEATARSASGFLLLMDGMVHANRAHSPVTMTYFGFGPMFRFSKFDVTLPVNGEDEFYSLNDMAIGLKFNLGATFRLQDFALRLDGQYYWEKQQYYGFSVSLLYGNRSR